LSRAARKFTQADVTALVKGVAAAGMDIQGVGLDAQGKPCVFVGKTDLAPLQQEANEWDRIQ
jgi:hypothetical protein